MRLKYIGLKSDGERAFMEKTGIEWMPGSEHDVDEKIAAEMLEHPTIWQQVGNEPVAQLAAAQPRARHLPADDSQDDEQQQAAAAQGSRPDAVDDQDVDDAAAKAEAAAKAAAKVHAHAKPAAKTAKQSKPAAKTAKAKAKK